MSLVFLAALSAVMLVYTFFSALGASGSYRYAIGVSMIFVGGWLFGFFVLGEI